MTAEELLSMDWLVEGVEAETTRRNRLATSHRVDRAFAPPSMVRANARSIVWTLRVRIPATQPR